ncbi:winged helix-turn-helix transcriptional regulator [Nesterenkonia ebinurensis]|uniref:winged helix-turn-helix transcriptional regulator n=1 Tax=Nesterenkonia ebinurensis TaxID=2608252 RepID=UPI00123E36F8|nr:winged helix-turn-helix transcriptional regulator [Nesterenkonia ebinurensis]
MARTYGEGCPIALSLDILGERWALLVVRELRLGPRRYRDLQEALPGITPAVLSRRLKELEETGVLRRRQLPPPASAQVYELTTWGAELEPVFQALARWGVRSPVVPLTGEISADSAMLGLRTFFNADDRDHQPWTATYEVWLDREPYRLNVDNGRLVEVARGPSPDRPADVVVHTTKNTWQAVLGRKQTLSEATAAGLLEVTGDFDTLQLLIDAPTRIPTSGRHTPEG